MQYPNLCDADTKASDFRWSIIIIINNIIITNNHHHPPSPLRHAINITPAMKGRILPPRTRLRRPLGTAVKKPKDEPRGKASELSVVPKDAFYAASRAKWRSWLSKNFKSKSYVSWKIGKEWKGCELWDLRALGKYNFRLLRIKFLHLVRLLRACFDQCSHWFWGLVGGPKENLKVAECGVQWCSGGRLSLGERILYATSERKVGR